MGQEEYQELSSFLKRFIRRFRFLEGIEGTCITAICCLLLFALGPGIGYLTKFFPYAPLAYTVLTGSVVIFLAGRTVLRICRSVSQERAALYIEKKQPKLRNNLINSLQLYPRLQTSSEAPDFSASMVLALLRSTRKQLSGLRIDDLIDTGNIKAYLRLLGIVFVPVVMMVLLNPPWVSETFSLLTRPLDHLPPSQTAIDISPKGVRVVRGSPITIEAVTSGAVPESLELAISSGSDERGAPIAEEKLPMERLSNGRFTIKLPRLDKTVRYRAVTGTFFSSTYTAEALDAPEVGNVQTTLYPPAYTGLGAVSTPGGSVEGIRGSTVRIQATTTKNVVKADLVLQDGKRITLKIDGRNLQGNLVLFQSQQYQIAVEDADGIRNSPIAYDLRVKPDGFPTIELLRPTEDLEISGDEILPLEYTARDDFGISEVNLAFKIGERQDKIRLQREDGRRLVLRDQFRWDLSRIGLREGEDAIFHLEVLDNDTISGPKLGTSRAIRLRLKNLKGEHQQVAEMIRDLNQRMVDLLGDHLEAVPEADKQNPTAKELNQKFEQNLGQALKQSEELLRRTEKDRLSDFATWSDLEALKRNLQFTKDELLPKHAEAAGDEARAKTHDEISSELERMSLLSEDLGKRLKAQELASTAQDLARSQERLMDTLEKLQSSDKNLDSILQQISELGKLLSSLQQALSQFAQQMPDDFMNMDSMRGLGFNEMFSALDQIRKKLMQGDIEGARQLARELFSQMAAMVAALQNSQRSAMSSAMGRMQGEMSRSANELQQIAREQQEILLGTEGLNKSALSERDQVLKDKLDRFLARAKEELGALTELFPDREGGESGDQALTSLDDATMNHLLKNLISKLLNRDFPGYAEANGMAQKELSKKRTRAQEPKAKKAEASLAGLQSELESIIGEPARALGESDKRDLRQLGQRQQVLQERTRDLHEKLESLFQLFPALDPKIVQNIGEAGTSMGRASDRLGNLDARNAVPPEQDALNRLTQSQQQMQSAMQQMAQRGQLGNMPVPMVFQRGRFLPGGMLLPLPGVPQFPEFNVDGGITGLDMERFRLPGKEEYKAPRNFREEILESLKQGIPPQHKDQIERYFKNLTE